MLIRLRNTYGTRGMTHDRCMIEMAESTQRACMHAIAEAWLPVLLRAWAPLTADNAGPADLERLTTGLPGNNCMSF